MNALARILAALIAVSAATPALARGARAPRTPSSVERQQLNATITPEPLGLYAGTYFGAVTGISAGFFVEPDLVLRAALHTGKSCTGERCSYAYDAASVTVQNFVGNSLFLEGGVAREQHIEHLQDTDYDDYAASSSRRFAFNYEAVDTALTFGLGNEWQWNSFTLGVRWVSMTVPVLTNKAVVTSLNPAFTAGDDEQKELKRLAKQNSVTLANLFLGWSF